MPKKITDIPEVNVLLHEINLATIENHRYPRSQCASTWNEFNNNRKSPISQKSMCFYMK